MRIGAEDKKKLMVMAALVAVALALLVYNFKGMLWGSSAAAPSSAPSVATQQKKAATATPIQDPSQDPRLRVDILEASRRVTYEPGRDIFHMRAVSIPPVDKGVRPTATPPPLPTPTPIPQIPLKYYGFASKPGETKRVFLSDDKDVRVFVAGQGDIVDRRYRLVQIQPNSVLMEDVLTGNRQAIDLTPRPLTPR